MRSLNELLWEKECVEYVLSVENEVKKELPQMRDVCYEILSSCGGSSWGGPGTITGPRETPVR